MVLFEISNVKLTLGLESFGSESYSVLSPTKQTGDMTRLLYFVLFLFMLSGCDTQAITEEQNDEPLSAIQEKARNKSKINPKYLDYSRNIDLNNSDIFISRGISLTGRQISEIKERWPDQGRRYFAARESSKESYGEPGYDQDSCFGRDVWIDPELCECILFPATCGLNDPPPAEDYPPGGGSGGDGGGGGDDGDDGEESPTTCDATDIDLRTDSEINYQVVDNRVYAGGRSSSSVVISGDWTSCLYQGNAKVEAEVSVVDDFNQTTTLQDVSAGGLSSEFFLVFVPDPYAETEWGIDYPLQTLQRVELQSTHRGEYNNQIAVGVWTSLPTEFRLEVANF